MMKHCANDNPWMMPALVLMALAAPSAFAQCEWVSRGYGPDRATEPVAAYDASRQRMVMLGDSMLGQTMWEWHGAGWEPRYRLEGHLPHRESTAMAYDPISERTLAFGGRIGSSQYGQDLWEFDGDKWRAVAASGPPARAEHDMAFDVARQRLVLFGGVGPGLYSDTWEWDGQAWMQAATTGPAARRGHAMAFDAARQRTILFGGFDAADPMNDTWEWDGAQWIQVLAGGPASPPARHGHTMTYHPQRKTVIVVGGEGSQGLRSDMWEWDGASWMELTTPTQLPARSNAAAAFYEPDGTLVIAAGSDGSGWAHADTWEWDGNDWSLRAEPGPSARILHAMAYDPIGSETLVVSGAFSTGDVWAWDGEHWHLRASDSPNPRFYHNVAFDEARARLVFYGVANAQARTWLWDGDAWSLHAGASPPPRQWPAMAYDSHRERVILYGGFDEGSSQQHLDTWEWDGTQWTEIITPGPDPGGMMTFDSTSGLAILLTREGTWGFDGNSWVQLADASDVNQASAIAYDPVRQRTVIFGMGGSARNETWEFDGNSWTQLPILGPLGRDTTAMAWDSDRDRIVLFGGNAEGRTMPVDDIWELVCEPPACYANCDGSTTPPILTVNDFTCFINEFAVASSLPPEQQVNHYANCDGSTTSPVLTVNDFTCFINAFAAGCS